MLGRHPDLNIFGEFETCVCLSHGPDLPSINSYHQFIKTDRETLNYQLHVDEELSYKSLIKSFLAQIYDRNPKQFIGASVHSRMDMLPEIWPNAKYLHLLRDPRDVSRSCIGMGWVGNVYDGSKYWVEPEKNRKVLFEKTLEKQNFLIKYEDLVKNPEKHLTEICEFIGVSFDQGLTNIDKNSTYSQPDPKYAEQWKTKLTTKEISLVESQCWELMKDQGYEIISPSKQPPNLFLALVLKVSSRLYRMKFGIRRFGFFRWLRFVVSKRLGPQSFHQKVQLEMNEIVKQHLR